jgi:glutamine synthetase
VVFNGDGYSDDWQTEAASRGLPNLKTTLDALPELIKPDAIALFEKYSVFSDREMHSRYEIGLEQYALTIGVEARLTLELATTVILPAALRYQTELASNVATLKAAGIEPSTALLEEVSGTVATLEGAIKDLKAGVGDHSATTVDGHAEHAQSVLPAMEAVRAAADTLESVVADDLWPLPTYQEMLYIL